MSRGDCESLLKTSLCVTGLGGNNTSTKKMFMDEEKNCHINELKLKAVYFDLKSLCRDIKEKHTKVLTDNIAAVLNINKMGSCKTIL